MGFEVPCGSFSNQCAGNLRDVFGEFFCFCFEESASLFGQEAFFGSDSQQFVDDFIVTDLLDEEVPCGDLDPRDGCRFCAKADGGEEVVFSFVKEDIVG